MANSERLRETLQQRVDRETRIARAVMEDIQRRRTESEKAGVSFTALTEDQLLRKIRSANSPMIVWQSWGGGSPGSTVQYNVGITNPDPTDSIWLFAHVFVGEANISPDIGQALAAVDHRFATLTMPAFPGLTIKTGGTEQLQFTIPVPAGVERTNYMGNIVLYQATWHDPAVYLDRGLFVFTVS